MPVGFDWRVFGFTSAVTLITGMAFGIAPAWRSTHAEINTAPKRRSPNLQQAAHALVRQGDRRLPGRALNLAGHLGHLLSTFYGRFSISTPSTPAFEH
jgi:hypothetical protein